MATLEEELQQIVEKRKPPQVCHYNSQERPTHFMCGIARMPGATTHGPSPFEDVLATGICSCGLKKCPECVRILAYQKLYGS